MRYLALVSFLLAPGLVLAEEEHRILVLDLQATAVEPTLARNLSELLVGTVRNLNPGATVLGQSEIQALLMAEEQKVVMGCEADTACLAEIGGAMGAGHMVTGNVGKIGSVYLINFKLIDTKHSRVLGHAYEKVGDDVEDLLEAVERMTYKIFAGRIVTAAAVAGSTAPGHVTPPELSRANEDDSSWYSSWWFWTVAGAVVAGSVGAGVLLSGGDPDPDNNTASGSVRVSLTPP